MGSIDARGKDKLLRVIVIDHQSQLIDHQLKCNCAVMGASLKLYSDSHLSQPEGKKI